MPREYIPLLIAELLPVLDGFHPCIRSLIEEKRNITMGYKDLFDILAAVEHYFANENTVQKGSELLSQAYQRKGNSDSGLPFRNWKELIPMKSAVHDIIRLFRIKATHIIAHLYITN